MAPRANFVIAATAAATAATADSPDHLWMDNDADTQHTHSTHS